MFTLIDSAVEFAAVAHDKQYRKSTNIPYISHPVAVGFMLQALGCSEEVVAASILHDVIEDTPYTKEGIEDKFGKHVANLVEGASEQDKSLSWEERKQHTIEQLKHASLELKYVVLGDKIHNLKSIVAAFEQEGEQVWERFKRGKAKQQWYYQSIYNACKQTDDEVLSILLHRFDALYKVLFETRKGS
ncbi:HD domain-containing protein [Bacillus tianshenii]|nr:HD domain-containing protein [Bacillus tianshenii]